MNDILNSRQVLMLNAAWQPIGQKTVADSIVAMCGGRDGSTPPALALDITYSEEKPDELLGIRPVKFDEWITLPIRPNDMVIHSAKLTIRVPTVLICPHFNKMPKKVFKLTKKGIYDRDGGRCQYTGKLLPKNSLNVDHVIPKDRGGKDTWENCVLADKSINSKKGNKLNSEVGLTLIRQPKAPLPMPFSALIKEARNRDWEHFLLK